MKDLVEYHKTVLDSGLRVVSEKVPSARSIAFGVWIDVGSRDEIKNENGISHFIEHMMFKGTKKRNTKEIAGSLESVGGSLNAFTSREQTCYHALVLDEHLEKAVDIIADILMNSTLQPANLEREKSVVIEEIKEVDESPSELIHELFSNCFWRGHPLGWPIMGSAKNIRTMNRERLVSYMYRHYRAGRIVISAAGNVSHRKLIELIKPRFHFLSGNEGRGDAAANPDELLLKFYKNKGSQTHFCFGFPGVSFSHPERNTLLALNTYLGGGMSSVLFQKIREDKGIAYTVYTFPDFYRDNGLLGIYLAADRKKVQSAVEIVLRELKKMKHERIPRQKLDQLKAQIKGNMTLSLESTMSRMSRLGRQELLTGKRTTLDESLQAIDKIKPDQIIELARRIFNHQSMTITSLGSARANDLKTIDWSVI